MNQLAEAVQEATPPKQSGRIKDDGPAWFPQGLLRRAKAARLSYFENDYVQFHARMEQVSTEVLGHLCPPGNDPRYHRKPVMVFLFGPPQVGKTTTVAYILQELLKRTRGLPDQEQGWYAPAIYITLDAEKDFDWKRYYLAILEALKDPFLEHRKKASVLDLQKAVESAIKHRRVEVIIIDEAQHLAKASKGANLQNQLDKLKHFQNELKVSHVLVGTYDMDAFRRVNAQLACRAVEVHFRRYDARVGDDKQDFRSVVWTFQRQLPVPKEPALLDHWKLLYDRTFGCVGLLKELLKRALAQAIREGAETVTEAHLLAASLSKTTLQLEWDTIKEGEEDFLGAEEAEANEEEDKKKYWFTEESLQPALAPPETPAPEIQSTEKSIGTSQLAPSQPKATQDSPPRSPQQRRVGEPKPNRTLIGLPPEGRDETGRKKVSTAE
jgi:AAA domain